MGIKSLASNNKKKFKSAKTQKWKRQKKAEKKKQQTPKEVNIEDVHLFSDEKLKNKLRNPQNNIKISGKKKRRLTKRLGHSLREKSQMQVDVNDKQSKRKQEAEDAEMVEEVANTEVRAKSEKDKQEAEDAEMVEEVANTEVKTSAEAATSSTEAASSSAPAATGSGKKRRNRKKKNKEAGGTTVKGNMFEENDGWEDVEMAE
ncbi:hypothetical protein RRG08_013502 [Elysia crispata]|uniref:Uncharacterized protein n=2 Tax=Elysia crispata TaxID=231223 RepID=A0AAE0Y133_9GAST|nr:hypothetical protein RRG08_013502 [Elysia crispata]